MTRALDDRMWDDPGDVRRLLEPLLHTAPDLFPEGMPDGFQRTGRWPASEKMPGGRLRHLRLPNGRVCSVRPRCVMRDMTGTVKELAHPLLLLSLGVPCGVVTNIFGHHDMYWYRLLERLGRNRLVGTTVRDPARLPEHLAADEPHPDGCGEQGPWPEAVLEMVTTLWNRESDSGVSYAHPGCHRTSNLVDRLMNRLTRFLYAGRGLHGHQSSCERRLRGLGSAAELSPIRAPQWRASHVPQPRTPTQPEAIPLALAP